MNRVSAILFFLGKAALFGGLYLTLGLGWALIAAGTLGIAAGVLSLDAKAAPRGRGRE